MLMLFEFLYPDSRLFSVYDNATIHRAKGAHAPDASIMNLSPGGKQRKQRATTYTIKLDWCCVAKVMQPLVDTDGVAKGLLAILLERGEQWTKTPSKKLAVAMLSEYDDSDFKDQASWIERIFRASPRGHQMIFAPKYHPELQYPIESSWAKMKGHLRRNCRHTLKALRENIIAALEPALEHPADARAEVVPQDARLHGGVRGRRHWRDRRQGGQAVQVPPPVISIRTGAGSNSRCWF
jgi:hypothetical protein